MALGWLIRFLVVMVLVRLGWKFLVGLVEGATQPPQVTPKRGVPLVRDPVCGTYVDRGRALSFRTRSEVYYFCSEDCLTAYRQQRHESARSS